MQDDAFCFEAGQLKAADRLERGERKLAKRGLGWRNGKSQLEGSIFILLAI